jgi:hypothetical protein
MDWDSGLAQTVCKTQAAALLRSTVDKNTQLVMSWSSFSVFSWPASILSNLRQPSRRCQKDVQLLPEFSKSLTVSLVLYQLLELRGLITSREFFVFRESLLLTPKIHLVPLFPT